MGVILRAVRMSHGSAMKETASTALQNFLQSIILKPHARLLVRRISGYLLELANIGTFSLPNRYIFLTHPHLLLSAQTCGKCSQGKRLCEDRSDLLNAMTVEVQDFECSMVPIDECTENSVCPVHCNQCTVASTCDICANSNSPFQSDNIAVYYCVDSTTGLGTEHYTQATCEAASTEHVWVPATCGQVKVIISR